MRDFFICSLFNMLFLDSTTRDFVKYCTTFLLLPWLGWIRQIMPRCEGQRDSLRRAGNKINCWILLHGKCSVSATHKHLICVRLLTLHKLCCCRCRCRLVDDESRRRRRCDEEWSVLHSEISTSCTMRVECNLKSISSRFSNISMVKR